MDRLETIFALQKALDDDITQRRGLGDISWDEWVQKDVLAITAELGELLDEVNFKWWKNKKEFDMDSIHEELIDILHFYVSMCIRAGMDADRLFDVYQAKNRENIDRQYGRSSKIGYEVVE